MPDPALFALTWRVVRRRLAASPAAVAAAAAFPALVAWIGLGDSYRAAARLFVFLLPHVFLVAAQDAVRSDVESGALENVLFLGGRFRDYVVAKLAVLAAVTGAYAGALFALLAGWGLARGAFEPALAAKFGLALLAGCYYLAVAGALSFVLRGGSNVLVLLLAQAGLVVGLLFTVTSRAGILDYAATGRFPGPGPKLVFGAMVAVLPNVVVSERLTVFAAEIAAGLGLALAANWRLARRLELGR